MLSRIMVAIVGIPLLIYILYHGGFPLLFFVNIIVGMGAYEFIIWQKWEEKNLIK